MRKLKQRRAVMCLRQEEQVLRVPAPHCTPFSVIFCYFPLTRGTGFCLIKTPEEIKIKVFLMFLKARIILTCIS